MISEGQVEHVAQLARLALSDEEKQRLTEQLNAILTYSLIPKPAPALLNGYLKTLSSEAERERTTRLITDYAEREAGTGPDVLMATDQLGRVAQVVRQQQIHRQMVRSNLLPQPFGTHRSLQVWECRGISKAHV